MIAARLHKPGEALRLEEVPTPKVGRGQVLIEVRAAGICGTDLHFMDGSIPLPTTPRTLGHEVAGTVAAVGAGVEDVRPGMRVLARPGSGCGRCSYCLRDDEVHCPQLKVLGMDVDGAFASHVLVPERAVMDIPEKISFPQAAIIPDAVATAYHAVSCRAQVQPGEVVAVWGCGGLGFHGLLAARLAGAAALIVVDSDPQALARAQEAGADIVVDASEGDPGRRVRRLSGGCDVALEFVGNKAVAEQALLCLKPHGRLVLVGVGLDRPTLSPLQVFVWGEYEVRGSFGSHHRDVERVLALVSSGRLDLARSISATFPLAQVNEAAAALRERRGSPVRLVLVPPNERGKQGPSSS